VTGTGLQIHRFPVPAAVCSSTGISPARPLHVSRDARNLQGCPRRQLKPAKDKSTERIDGIVATIMAIGRALVAQEEPQPEYSLFFV
jgi:hypothetical protein